MLSVLGSESICGKPKRFSDVFTDFSIDIILTSFFCHILDVSFILNNFFFVGGGGGGGGGLLMLPFLKKDSRRHYIFWTAYFFYCLKDFE